MLVKTYKLDAEKLLHCVKPVNVFIITYLDGGVFYYYFCWPIVV